MSDPMSRGAPMGNPKAAASAIAQNRSVFNPTDMAAMGQTGDVTANMTIAQFFSKFGIDVNRDPVTKLAQFTQDQLSKANPMNKMSAIAGGSPSGAPSPGQAGGGGQSAPVGNGPPPAGLADLMRG